MLYSTHVGQQRRRIIDGLSLEDLLDRLENCLELCTFKRNSPSNVLALGDDDKHPSIPAYSDQQVMRFGMKTQGAEGGAGLSIETSWENWELIYMLNRIPLFFDPSFKCTSLQVSKNTKFSMHCDRGSPSNSSAIFGLGNFTGGGLNVFNPTEDRWEPLDINRKFHQFSGRDCPHYTRRFKGDRYSLTWYTKVEMNKLTEAERKELRNFGFRLPLGPIGENWLHEADALKLVRRAKYKLNKGEFVHMERESTYLVQEPERQEVECVAGKVRGLGTCGIYSH